ncbi:MAG: efflux transporter outer membrane subunit [Proteobacteria bacterium]|nr:efflux transporter outer membrane subunit [Pseudomonadota bacterium]
MMRSPFVAGLVPWTAALLLAGCMVGPDYARAPAVVPEKFKEQGIWKVAQPLDEAPRGAWWTIYKDPLLDQLVRQIDIDNQTLKAAEAAYRDTVAVVQQAQSTLFPTVTASATDRTSRGVNPSSGAAGGGGGNVRSLYSLSASASWTIDVWGRIRRIIEGDIASAQVSAADLAAARLSAQGALASAYLQLRVQDELKRLLDSSAEAYAQSLQIVRNQYASGVVGRSDVAQAETQLKSTQAQAINTGVQRAQLEHAIAVLIGLPPASFQIDPEPLALEVPQIPAGVPSTLLQRRPDIAAAERQMQAANAQIGVAIAAYYPDFTLAASVGYSNSILARLIQEPNQFWSVGPALAATVLDAGARSAQVAQARALHEQAVANYRQTVLTGFQQVEDQLAALRVLAEQAGIQAEALTAAREAERLIFNQYRAGTVSFTNVVVAQTAALSNAQTALTIRGSRLTASVSLLQALGGSWDASQLPTREQIIDTDPRTPIPISATVAPPR